MAETPEFAGRVTDIRNIHKEYGIYYTIGIGIFLVLIGVLIGAVIFSDEPGYGTNIYTELLSVGLTIGVLNVLQERRDTRNRIKDLQEQLIRDAGSPVNGTTLTAINTMRKRGWLGRDYTPFGSNKPIKDTESLLENADLYNADLHDSNLRYANLTSANLERTNLTSANLVGANLSSANLVGANLSSAILYGTKLVGANLWVANLSSADLMGANLSGVRLEEANLTNANLSRTNLTGANLIEANLTSTYWLGANLSSANLWLANLSEALIHKSTIFDETIILPDGTNWSEGRNLSEFGAETREIVDEDWKHIDNTFNRIYTYTFADGTKRRYQPLKGWLDDRDGNPIEDNT